MAFSAIVRGGQEQLMFHSLAYEFLKKQFVLDGCDVVLESIQHIFDGIVAEQQTQRT